MRLRQQALYFFSHIKSTNQINPSMKTDSIKLQRSQRQEGALLLSKFASSFVAIFILTAMISCSDEDEADPDSPSYHIAASEKLVIPVEVDLPNSGNTRVA